MKMVNCYWIFLLLTLCKGEWEKSIRVNAGEFDSIKPINLYHDYSTGIGYLTMLSFETDNKQSLVSRKYLPDSSTLSSFSIKDQTFEGFAVEGGNMNIIHVSAENGKDHIAVWSKERGSGPCNSDNTRGCFDVYFAVSQDDGETWGKVIQVPRKNLTDWAGRERPSVLYIKETGRVLIFYRHYQSFEKKYYIGFVTKPSGSTIFSNEVLIEETKNVEIFNTPVYTYSNNKATIHLIYAVEVEDYKTEFRYTSSINGINWEKPQLLYTSFSVYFKFYVIFSEHTIDYKAIHAVFSKWGSTENNMISIMSSYDEGKTWTEPIEFTNTVNLVSAAICGTEDSPIIFMVAMMFYPKQEYSFWMYNVNKEEFTEIEMPFGDLQGVSPATISCGIYKNQLLIRAFGYKFETKQAYVTSQKVDYPDLLKLTKH